MFAVVDDSGNSLYYGAGAGPGGYSAAGYGGRSRSGIAVDIMPPQSRDLYNYQGTFYNTDRFGGAFGPVAMSDDPANGSGYGWETITKRVNTQAPAAQPTTTATEQPTTQAPAGNAPEMGAAVVPLLIVLAVLAVLK